MAGYLARNKVNRLLQRLLDYRPRDMKNHNEEPLQWNG